MIFRPCVRFRDLLRRDESFYDNLENANSSDPVYPPEGLGNSSEDVSTTRDHHVTRSSSKKKQKIATSMTNPKYEDDDYLDENCQLGNSFAVGRSTFFI